MKLRVPLTFSVLHPVLLPSEEGSGSGRGVKLSCGTESIERVTLRWEAIIVMLGQGSLVVRLEHRGNCYIFTPHVCCIPSCPLPKPIKLSGVLLFCKFIGGSSPVASPH